jgi:hypothetical protein
MGYLAEVLMNFGTYPLDTIVVPFVVSRACARYGHHRAVISIASAASLNALGPPRR